MKWRVKKHSATCCLLATVLSAAPAVAAEVPLSLPEAIKTAVEKNLDIRVELYTPAVAEADLRGSWGIYDPRLQLLTSYTDSTTLAPGTSFDVFSRSATANVGISRLLPTGGSISAGFDNSWNNDKNLVQVGASQPTAVVNYWSSDVSLNLAQPLLKSFGREITEINIAVAENTKAASLDHFRSRLLDIVSRVRTEYLNLYSVRKDLEVKQISLKLAKKVLEETQARVTAGILPAMEIQNAQFGTASREKELIDAERAVKDQSDVVRLLLQYGGNDDFVPTDLPSRDPVDISVDQAIRLALAERPDLKELRDNIRIGELSVKLSRNHVLPDLNANAGVALTGIGGSYSRTLDRVGKGEYPAWNVGLSLSVPLGNTAAENEYIHNKLKLEQAKTQLASTEAGVVTDIRTAVRSISSNYKQIDVTERGRVYAEERLNSFMKKNAVGLATTKDVLDVENDLTAARGNETKALVGYNAALTNYWKLTGELLDRERVRLGEPDTTALYDREAGRR